MTVEELQQELRRSLPKQHPFIQHFEEHVGLIAKVSNNTDDEVDPKQILNRVFDALDDWGRGLRDWDEVERDLIDARNRF